MERLLVGEMIKTPKTEDGEVFAPSPRSPVASRKNAQRSVAELQHMIGKLNISLGFFFKDKFFLRRCCEQNRKILPFR